MQERVLGAIIIGAVALVGVVWAGIEGGINNAKARQGEPAFETALFEKVKDYDSTVTSLDARGSTCYSKTVKGKQYVPNWGAEDNPNAYRDIDVVTAFARVYGYTNDNKEFCITLQTAEGTNITDFEYKSIKTITEEGAAAYLQSDAYKAMMSKQFSANYAITATNFYTEICKKEGTKVIGYTVGDKEIVKTTYDADGTGHTFINGVEQK